MRTIVTYRGTSSATSVADTSASGFRHFSDDRYRKRHAAEPLAAALRWASYNIKLNKQRALLRYARMSPMPFQSVNRWLQWWHQVL